MTVLHERKKFNCDDGTSQTVDYLSGDCVDALNQLLPEQNKCPESSIKSSIVHLTKDLSCSFISIEYLLQ